MSESGNQADEVRRRVRKIRDDVQKLVDEYHELTGRSYSIMLDNPYKRIEPESPRKSGSDKREDPHAATLYCSFCGQSRHEVKKLVAGREVFICDECIVLCMDIIREELAASPLDD